MPQTGPTCGKKINFLNHVKGKDGLFYCSECVLVANKKGKTGSSEIGLLNTLPDISEEQIRALNESDLRYITVFDQSLTAVVHKNPQKIINKLGKNGWKVISMSISNTPSPLSGHASYMYIILEREDV